LTGFNDGQKTRIREVRDIIQDMVVKENNIELSGKLAHARDILDSLTLIKFPPFDDECECSVIFTCAFHHGEGK